MFGVNNHPSLTFKFAQFFNRSAGDFTSMSDSSYPQSKGWQVRDIPKKIFIRKYRYWSALSEQRSRRKRSPQNSRPWAFEAKWQQICMKDSKFDWNGLLKRENLSHARLFGNCSFSYQITSGAISSFVFDIWLFVPVWRAVILFFWYDHYISVTHSQSANFNARQISKTK
jgi:hypothetical protein